MRSQTTGSPNPFRSDTPRSSRQCEKLAPEADTTDPEWMHVTLPGVEVEVNVTDESPLESFASTFAPLILAQPTPSSGAAAPPPSHRPCE